MDRLTVIWKKLKKNRTLALHNGKFSRPFQTKRTAEVRRRIKPFANRSRSLIFAVPGRRICLGSALWTIRCCLGSIVPSHAKTSGLVYFSLPVESTKSRTKMSSISGLAMARNFK